MLRKVSFESYERCFPKRLKKFFQSDLNYKDYNFYISGMKTATVGNIPPEIIKLFKPEECATKSKSFQSAIAETAQIIRQEKDLEKAKEKLSENLKNIMPNGTESELEHVGYGGYKNVYRFGLKDKDGKKLMHDKALLVYNISPAICGKKSHGIYAEPNSWIYLQKNIGHSMDNTQFTKHYISDMKNGYTITEFIDDNIAKTTREFDHNKKLGLILTDSQNNPRINKKIYDIGGLIRCQGVLEDRTALKYFKKIANRNTQKEREQVVNQLTEKVKNPKTPLREKMQAALDYYNSLPPWYWLRTSDRIPIRMIW